MDLLRERLRARGPLCAVLSAGDSDESSTTTGATTTTLNADERMAVQNGVGINGNANSYELSTSTSSYFQDNSNSSDAVVAIAKMGSDVIKQSGGAVVDLYKNAGQQTSDAWNKTITQGAAVIDRLIDQVGDGFNLSEKVVGAFTPTENKNAEIGKYAMIAAAAVAAAVLLKGAK